MPLLTTQRVDIAGTLQTFGAAAAGDEFIPGPHVFLEVVTTTNATVVTIPTPPTYQGQAVADVSVSMGMSERRKIGPLPASLFAGADGRGDISYSVLTGVTVAVISTE